MKNINCGKINIEEKIYFGYQEIGIDGSSRKYILDRDQELVFGFLHENAKIYDETSFETLRDILGLNLARRLSTFGNWEQEFIGGYLLTYKIPENDFIKPGWTNYTEEDVAHNIQVITNFFRNNKNNWKDALELEITDRHIYSDPKMPGFSYFYSRSDSSNILRINVINQIGVLATEDTIYSCEIYDADLETHIYMTSLRDYFGIEEIPVGVPKRDLEHNYIAHFEGSRFVVRELSGPANRIKIPYRRYYSERDAYRFLDLVQFSENYRLWEEI